MKKLFKSTLSVLCLIMLAGNSIDVNAQSYYAWAKGLGGAGYETGNDIAVDKAGNVYVTGYYQSNPLDFGVTAALTNAGGSDAFVAKYDAAGNEVWIKGIGGTGSDKSNAIAVDEAGNVYITGGFSGSVNFSPGSGTALLTAVNGDGFLAKYNTNGDYVWVRNLGGDGTTGPDEGTAVALDSAGNIYVTGSFSGTAHHDTITLIAAGSIDIFVAKYDTAGNCMWAHGMGDNNVDVGSCIAVSESGEVYIGGTFRGDVDFNTGPGAAAILTSMGTNSDAFVAKYNANGDYVWARNMGGSSAGSMVSAYGITADRSGNAYLTGSFTGTVHFNPGGSTGELTSITPGPPDIFLAKYDAAGNYVWANNMGGTEDDWGMDISVDGGGNVYIVGMFGGTANFDPGSGSAPLSTSGSFFDYDVFLAKYDGNGDYVWAQRVGGTGGDEGYGITVDRSGNIYATGYFEGTADFDPVGGTGTLTGTGVDVFTLKLGCTDTSSAYIEVSLACGEAYTLNNTVYTAAGTYTQVMPNASGCDSTITLDLTFLPIDTPVITVDEHILGVNGTYATYQWIKNGAHVPGATGSTYTVTENADYQVAVTNEHGCADTSGVYTVTNIGIETGSTLAQQVYVYPNPVTDVLYIQSPVKVNIVVTDITGRVVREDVGANSISLKDLAESFYLLQIRDSKGSLIKMEKILKQAQ